MFCKVVISFSCKKNLLEKYIIFEISKKRDLSSFAGRTCLMFVVFLRRMMSTWQWSRPDTSVGSQTTFCLSITLLLQSVARKCCSSQGSLCHSTRCLVCCVRNGARSVPRNLTRHRLERVLTRFVDTHPWTAVCISQAKECCIPIHVLSLSHPCVVLARVARTTHVVLCVYTSRMEAELVVALH